MPNMNINFGGNVLFQPNVYYQDNVSANFVPANQLTLPLIYLGYGYNGVAGSGYTFNNPTDLLNFIRGGPASGYVNALMNPSPALTGSNNITFIPVGVNTPATQTLMNEGGSGVIMLTTSSSGVPSNLTQAEVTIGTQYSGYSSDITLYDGYSNSTYVGNNLGVPFQLSYTGTATGVVTFMVSGTPGDATMLSVTSSNPGESFNVSLVSGAYSTASLVVEYLNGTGFYAASLISDTGGQLPSSWLSPTGATTLTPPGSGTLVYAPVIALPYDAAFWVNQFASTIATAMVVSGASSTSPLASQALTHFAGATSTPPTNGSYASGFNAALNMPAWTVFADSNTLAVQVLGAQHAETASEPVSRANRRFFTGSSPGDSITTTIANAAAMNSLESCYAYPGITLVNTNTGQVQTFGGIMAAAMAAGIASSNQVALPLTNKPINAVGVEYNLTPSELNQVQIGGIMPIMLGGANGTTPTIISDFTTWQVDTNPLNVFTQQVACRWWLAYTMRNALQPYIGGIASPDTLTQISNAAKAALNASVYTPGSNGVLASWLATSLVVSYDGPTQTASVSATATTVGQYRFITETVTVQLYSGTTSGAA